MPAVSQTWSMKSSGSSPLRCWRTTGSNPLRLPPMRSPWPGTGNRHRTTSTDGGIHVQPTSCVRLSQPATLVPRGQRTGRTGQGAPPGSTAAADRVLLDTDSLVHRPELPVSGATLSKLDGPVSLPESLPETW
jgi:hypothetical protein